MTVFSLTSAFVSINGTDVSSWCKSLQLSVEANELETTTFTAAGWKTVASGLKSGSLQLTFNQDVAASQLEAIIWPLWATVVPWVVRPSSSVVGSSNPQWSGNLLVSQWSGVNGAVGDLAEVQVTWPLSGAVTRATS